MNELLRTTANRVNNAALILEAPEFRRHCLRKPFGRQISDKYLPCLVQGGPLGVEPYRHICSSAMMNQQSLSLSHLRMRSSTSKTNCIPQSSGSNLRCCLHPSLEKNWKSWRGWSVRDMTKSIPKCRIDPQILGSSQVSPGSMNDLLLVVDTRKDRY